MAIKLSEIKEVLETLKSDSQAMANQQVRTTVAQLDSMLNELELEGASAPDETGDMQLNISVLEQLSDFIPRILAAVSQKEPCFLLLIKLALTYRRLGEPERTTTLCNQILALTADDAFPYIRATAFKELGTLQFYQGQWSQAEGYYQQSLRLYEGENDVGYVATIRNNLGYIAAQQGNYDLAKEHHQYVIDIAGQRDDCKRLLAAAYNSLGIIATVQADWDATIDYFEKSITLYEEIDLPREVAGVYINLAMAYVDAEVWETAGECYAQATALAEKTGNLLTLSKIYINRGEFLLKINNLDAARLYGDKALAVFQRIKDNIGIADVYKLYGCIHSHQKDWDAAIEAFTQSLQLYQSSQNTQGEAEGCYEFGLMYKDCQNLGQAQYFLRRSLSLYQSLDAADEIRRIETLMSTLAA